MIHPYVSLKLHLKHNVMITVDQELIMGVADIEVFIFNSSR